MKQLLSTLLLISSLGRVHAQNVGIGTTTPTYPLTVISDGAYKGVAQKNGTSEVGFYLAPDGAPYLQTWSAHSLHFTVNNGLGKISIRYPDGFVGINQENPTAQLDVNGTFRLRNNGAGAGKVLTSDASGNATWVTPSSGLTLPYDGNGSSNTAHIFRINNTGTGLSAGYFINSNTSNNFYALQGVSTATGGGGVGVYGTAVAGTGTTSYGVRAFLSGTGTAGAAVYGRATNADGVEGESETGNGVTGIARDAGGQGGYFAGFTGAIGLRTVGGVRMTGISEGAGKVLTSDASGNATWQEPSGTGIGFSAYLNSSVSIPTGDYQPSGFVQDFEDGGNNFNSTTGEFTAPSAGVYQFVAKAGWGPQTSATVSTTLRIVVVRAGSTIDLYQVQQISPVLAGYGTGQQVSFVSKAQAGDVYKLVVVHSQSPTSLTLNGGTAAGRTTFSGYKVY